mmetsp:Transcript_805/g.1720  ORF Transcript_805/g.1720 Transcript_805/m.1720 type:complete len:416 (+) Transcript_805:3668-4915(+)
MDRYKLGDVLWAKNRQGLYVPSQVVEAKYEDIPTCIKRSRRANTLFVSFLPSLTDYHYINLTKIEPFKEAFDEFYPTFVQVTENLTLLEDVVNKLNWEEGRLKLQAHAPSNIKQRRRIQVVKPCFYCSSTYGTLLACKVCGDQAAHRKCCNSPNDFWTCPNHPEVKRVDETEGGYFEIPQFTPEELIEHILEACRSDDYLEQVIKSRQADLQDNLAEIEESRRALSNESLNDAAVRLKNFELFESERQVREHLRGELIDLLQGAHIEGFESLKKLTNLYGAKGQQADPKQFELYKKAQREVVDLLLSGKIELPFSRGKAGKPVTLQERLRDPSNPDSFASRLKSTVDKLKKLNLHDHKETFTSEHLAGLVRVVQDATIANCSYISSKRVEHVGGATDPRLLEGLFVRIRQTYLGS